jgi:Domain of unknown function (DUF6471)
MVFAKTEKEWQARASAFLKATMKESGVTYIELGKRLKKHGFIETEGSITMKLKRGTFAATFFLACLAALELDGISLEDL